MPLQLNITDLLCPLDGRYYASDETVFAALSPYLSEAATIRYQLRVEQAIIAEIEASFRTERPPVGISRRVAAAVEEVTAAEVYEEERRIQHNIRALVNCLRSKLPKEDRGYVHLFATSNDIIDTARAVALRDVTRAVLLPAMAALISDVIALAREYAHTPQIGRTHGRHAEPITVGYWLANYALRLTLRGEFIGTTALALRGKMSGAVGAHNALALKWPTDPSLFELQTLQRLGLEPAPRGASTQIVHPEYLTDFGHALVSTFSVFANMADDYRNLMRSEIDEVCERLDEHQVGSSTMPHKVNPKNFENVKSLWKAFMPRMITIYLDQISEHQRDLTNSASLRFFHELVASVAYAAPRLQDAIKKTQFNLEALHRNLTDSAAWIIAEPIYIALALAGHADPYDASRQLVDRARATGRTVNELLSVDPTVAELWSQIHPERARVILDPTTYVGDAPARTESICEECEVRIGNAFEHICHQLNRPSDAQGLIAA